METESGGLIRRKRKKLGLTLEEVASQLNVSKSTVSKWERGFIVNLKRDKLIALSQLLNISPLEIIEGEFIEGQQISINEFLNQLNYLLFVTDGQWGWQSPKACLLCAYSLSHVRLFVIPWTVACQASLSMGILQARILE